MQCSGTELHIRMTRLQVEAMTITCSEINQLLGEAMPDAQIEVQGGDGKFQVAVVSPVFEGLSRVKRQQAIYRVLNTHISSGSIHAVSMILKAPSETAA